jgi:hypothetical protein
MKKYLFFIVLFAAACSQTSIVSSWKSPDAVVSPDKFKKVLIAVFVKDETTRRQAEDRIVARNSAFHPSYMVFSNQQLLENAEACQQLITSQGYDAIITMQLVSVEESVNYVPGSHTGGYWGYHGYAHGGYYSPGYYSEDAKYVLATNLFDLRDGKLLWSAKTSTFNPTSVDRMVDEVASKLKQQMIKDKLIAL